MPEVLDRATVLAIVLEKLREETRRHLGPDVRLEAEFNERLSELEVYRFRTVLSALARDQVAAPDEFAEHFMPLVADERELLLSRSIRREGQGAFRSPPPRRLWPSVRDHRRAHGARPRCGAHTALPRPQE